MTRTREYKIGVTELNGSLTVNNVERLKRTNQHKSEWVSAPKATFSLQNGGSSLTLRRAKKVASGTLRTKRAKATTKN
jgi:hypothetical protein